MSWQAWLILTGILVAVGLVLVVIRCALDWFGVWPMDYSKIDGRPRR